MTILAPLGDERYRTIGEARIVDELIVHIWPFEARAGALAEARRDAQALLGRLAAHGLPYRAAEGGGRLFDPAEVVNFLQWVGLRGLEPDWARWTATGRRLVWEGHAQGDGKGVPPAPRTLGPQRYAVTITRTFDLEGHEPGDRVRLRLPAPIEDAALGDVRATFLPPQGVRYETKPSPARLDAVICVPDDRQTTVGVRAEFTARPVAPEGARTGPDASEAELYTRPSEGLIKVSERVRSLAADLAGPGTDAATAVRRFWDFMMGELVFGSMHYDELDPVRPADLVLEQGRYDCMLGSALFCALCRARGIPARMINGYVLEMTAPGYHTWLEAWIEGLGWVPFDLMCWGLSAGGRDPGWRDYYFGQVDHRMAVQRPPRLFSGLGDVRLPRSWQMAVALDGPGVAYDYVSLATGARVYREHVEVERLG